MDFVRSWISFKRNPFYGCHAYQLAGKIVVIAIAYATIISQKLYINGWVIIIVTYNFFNKNVCI